MSATAEKVKATAANVKVRNQDLLDHLLKDPIHGPNLQKALSEKKMDVLTLDEVFGEVEVSDTD